VGADTSLLADDEKTHGSEKIICYQNSLISKVRKIFKIYTSTGMIPDRWVNGEGHVPGHCAGAILFLQNTRNPGIISAETTTYW
jgi:hypothetical protein